MGGPIALHASDRASTGETSPSKFMLELLLPPSDLAAGLVRDLRPTVQNDAQSLRRYLFTLLFEIMYSSIFGLVL